MFLSMKCCLSLIQNWHAYNFIHFSQYFFYFLPLDVQQNMWKMKDLQFKIICRHENRLGLGCLQIWLNKMSMYKSNSTLLFPLTRFFVFIERDAHVMNVHSVRYKWVCFTYCIIAYILFQKCNRFMTDAG